MSQQEISIINLDQLVSMTSVEIAELTGKEHRNVLRDIRNMAEELSESKTEQRNSGSSTLSSEIDGISEDTFTDSRGKTYPLYRLDRKHTFILVAGYSVHLRAKCYDHIQTLERRVLQLEEQKTRAAVQSANRRGVTWGDYCKTHGLPAQRLKKAVLMANTLFRIGPKGRVEINPKYKEFFIVLKPADRRFSPNGINFRFNAKGLERFSTDKAVDRFRTMLIEQLGSDYEKSMLLASRAKAEGYDPTNL